jgi:hypothetical protein
MGSKDIGFVGLGREACPLPGFNGSDASLYRAKAQGDRFAVDL